MTTICAVKKDNQVAMAGDGQVTMGEKVIMKGTARKIRRIFDNQVLVGFAGGVADAITLEEMFEDKLKQFKGNLQRAAIEMAKQWSRYANRARAIRTCKSQFDSNLYARNEGSSSTKLPIVFSKV